MKLLNDDLSRKRQTRICLLAAFLLPFLWLCILRPMSMNQGETANDAYYHAAMAERGPAVFCAKKFPALELSVWRDTFADKELLYHFLLSGLIRVQKIFTAEIVPPFHFPAMVFVAGFLAAFLFAMKRMGVAPPLYLPMTMAAVLIAPNITFRVLMLRPHVLSLALLLFLCGILAAGSFRKRLLWTLGVSMVYAWSYSNPQFIVIPALAFSIAGIRTDGWKSLLIAAAAAVGVGLGLLVHPQFPNSFIIWKVQSFDALFRPLLAEGAKGYASLMPPMEMQPPDLLWHLAAIPLYVFVYLAFLVFARVTGKCGWKNLPQHVIALGMLTLLFTGGTFLVQRTVEYAAPFGALFGAAVTHLALQEKVFLPGREKPLKFCLILSIAMIGIAVYSSVLNIGYGRISTPPAAKIGAWMERNLPEKTLVVNLNWGDFPAIFHANRKQVFLWGMDPEFSVAADPERTRKIERMLLQAQHMTPRRFYALTGSRYALVLAKRENFIRYLKKIGWRAVYEAEDGALFIVE